MSQISNELVNEITGEVEVVETVQTVEKLNVNDAIAALEAAEKLDNAEVAFQINSEYYEFKVEKEKVRGIYMGTVPVSFKDKQNPGVLKHETAARWIGKDRKMYLCAGAALVNELTKAGVTQGTPIEIEYTGKGKDGQVKLYNVSVLTIK